MATEWLLACWEGNREFASNSSQVYQPRLVRETPCSVHPPIISSQPCHSPTPPYTPSYLDLEPEPGHAAAVQVDGRLAVLLGVGGVGEEHALVALGLFVLAHAAGLLGRRVSWAWTSSGRGPVGALRFSAPWAWRRPRWPGPSRRVLRWSRGTLGDGQQECLFCFWFSFSRGYEGYPRI